MDYKGLFLLLPLLMGGFLVSQPLSKSYICPPCDLPCDTLHFDGPGTCPRCHMTLVNEERHIRQQQLLINEISLDLGSGYFMVNGGKAHLSDTIWVHYHMPSNYHEDSPILMVIPGAGRNGDSYRDAWKELSEEKGVLILSPEFPERMYPFDKYHLGGLVSLGNLQEAITYEKNSNRVYLDESQWEVVVSAEREKWLFSDFDRIFDLVVVELSGKQGGYDIFGHSAGGQILHRMALFYPESKAKRIVAGNSGFYTLPSTDFSMPLGIKGSILTEEDMEESFSKNLVVLVGELDNDKETGGTLLRSPSVDRQGLHRLARAKFFIQQAQTQAKALGFDLNWELQVVPGVGHNQRKMAKAAAKYLYP